MSESNPVNKVVDTGTAEHYLWGDYCDGWRLVRTEELSVIEESMPARTREQRHFHNRARQFFYVLAGELTMEVNGQVQRLGKGQGLEISPGQAHQARNNTGEPVRFLVVSQPPTRGDRVNLE